MATSKLATIETRLSAVEAELLQLKQTVTHVRNGTNSTTGAGTTGTSGDEWMDKIYGVFADDPIFDQIVAYGREYRESLRPKTRRTKATKKAKPTHT
jgi:hypothetical protein